MVSPLEVGDTLFFFLEKKDKITEPSIESGNGRETSRRLYEKTKGRRSEDERNRWGV